MSYPIARELTSEEIVEAVKAAFRPLTVGVDPYADYGNQVRFKVTLPNGSPFSFNPSDGSSKSNTPAQLNTILQEARARIEKMGFALEAWTPIQG